MYEDDEESDLLDFQDWKERQRSNRTEPFEQWEWVSVLGMEYPLYQVEEVIPYGKTFQYVLREQHSGMVCSRFQDELHTVDPQPAPEKMIDVAEPAQPGEIIFWHGHTYRVMKTHIVTVEDAADIEDMNDVLVEPGRHTICELIS